MRPVIGWAGTQSIRQILCERLGSAGGSSSAQARVSH